MFESSAWEKTARVITRRARLLLALLAAALTIGVAGLQAGDASALTTAANCALPGSTFQGGDGDQYNPTLAEETYCTEHLLPTSFDWQNEPGVVNSPDAQAEDTIFSGGNKESAPESWVIETQAGGATPGKTNIISAWSKADPQPASTFLYMSFERAATTGDTYLTFELNQVKGLWENQKKATIPCRTTGDILISYNVGGGMKVSVTFYRWSTDTSQSVVIPPDPTPHACAKTGHFEPAEGTPVESPLSQGAMNSSEITNYLTDTANQPTPTKFAAGSFGEAALNLTGIFEAAKLGSCFAFGQMWMSSRSSEAIDSQLQDYLTPVPIQTDSCSISGRKFDDANGSGTDEPGKPGLEGWTIQLLDPTGTKVLQTTTTGPGGSYSFTTVAPGTYVIREVAQSGWTCDYPGTGSECEHTVTLNSENVNSAGNDFGNHPTTTVTTEQSPTSGVVGTKFGDRATVSGPATAPTPTGNVEFTLYSDNHCGTAIAGPIVETLSGGVAVMPEADEVTPAAGRYWWVATYPGDSGNAAGKSGCADEPITVTKAAPEVTTKQAPSSGIVGTTFKDHATVSGLFGSTPGGTVSWKLFNSSTCEGTPVATDGPVTVTGNGEYTTPNGASPTPAGTYYWVATYSGDANNKEASSGCAAEPVTVEKATPGIVTTEEPASGVVGATFKDKATLSGLFGAHPGGSVSWKLYGNSKCEGTPIATDGPVSVTANGGYTTPNGASPVPAGTYYWVATYSGDANNEEASSGCAAEPVEVEKASPGITTAQKPSSGAVGSTFKDEAKLTGLFGTSVGGSISWKLYANSKCEGTPVATDGPVSATGDGSYTTPNGASPVPAGTYYWVSTYSGDANNAGATSGCAAEPAEVEKAAPGIVTSQEPAAGTVGATFKDKATVSGAFGAHPAGSISWKLYGNSRCEGTPVATDGPVTVTGSGSYATPNGASPVPAGTYYWVASYTGDTNNEGATSGCAAEPVEVEKATPAISTSQEPASGTVGATFNDKATLSGVFGAHPAGAISWKLFNNSKCEGTPVADGPVTVTGNGEYTTPTGAAPTLSGTYYWVATYSGDANNESVSSGCADEPVKIGQATPEISTTQEPASGGVGSTFKDKATLTGLFGAHPAGTVSWQLFDNDKCEGTPVATDGPVTVTGDGSYTTPNGASPVPAGTYYWVATYSGDANNEEASSGCAAEPVEVEKASPGIVTTQEPASGSVGATFKDKATLSGAFGTSVGGSISWKLYANSKCEGTPVAIDGPVSATGDGSYTAPNGASPVPASTYYWVATYSGDANNAGATSGCTAEPVEVEKLQPHIVTTQEPASGVVGATFEDEATLSGAFNATGSITWRLYSNSKCEGSPVATEGSATVTGNSEYSTPTGASPVPAGTYYWVASYSGDANNEPADSGCAAEPVNVEKAAPEIVTTQEPSSGIVGATFKDKAKLSGAFGTSVGGSIIWVLYDNSKCGGTPVASDGPVTVDGNGEYTTPNGASPTLSGMYYWVATYSGDANNNGVSSGCADEPIGVGLNTPAISTAQRPASGIVGATFKDEATITALFGAHPAGSVSWKLYGNDKCEGAPVATDGPVSVTGNGGYTTPNGASPVPAGTYYWVATYSGDPNNNSVSSGCADEPITVGPATPAISTTQEPAAGIVGATFKDEAKLSGLFGASAGGSVSWKLYDNDKCEGEPVATDGPVSVDGNGEYTTPHGASPTLAGTYYWVATYSGDANNKSVSSGCADEPVVISPATPAIVTTQQPASATIGATFKDEATISGLFGESAGGSVRWTLYSNNKCEGTPLATDGPVAVDGDGDYTTPSGASPATAGTYYWVATYSGDANNKSVSSGCADEPIDVGRGTPGIVTTQQPASGALGANFKDEATISGLSGASAGGSVSWKLYANSKCEGEPIASDGPVPVSGNGEYITPSGATPAQAGTDYWVATYSGDQNNKELQSGCADEPISVGQATPAITTKQMPATGTVGNVFKDSATLSGGAGSPSGTISWKLYSNNACEGTPIASDGPVNVNVNGTYATPNGATPAAGTYYWVATYSGDSNNKAVSSGCADELVAVAGIAVLSEKAESGTATPGGPAGCIAKATEVYVKGRQIVTATFYVDGRKVKTVSKRDKHGRYALKLTARKLRYGAHRVRVVVTFTSTSGTKPVTLRLAVVRCRPVVPKFTG
jgi:SdrD B-like domain